MPRISAATVAEHRAAQRRSLLDAAHAIIEATGEGPAMSEVADRAGLARSSVYQYFSSRADLLNAMVQDVFPRWTERVTSAMQREVTPGRRILAYALANVQLVDEGAHAIGTALATLAPGEELDEQAGRMHRQIQEPLHATLVQLGVDDADSVAELINGVVHAATRLLESGQSLERVAAHLELVLAPLAQSLDRQAAGPQDQRGGETPV